MTISLSTWADTLALDTCEIRFNGDGDELIVNDGEADVSKLLVFTFNESNSGGYYRMTAEHYYLLRKDGWIVQPPSESDRYGGRKALVWATSRDEAVARWENATGLSTSDAGCSCCGVPYQFYEGDWAF